MSLLMDALKKAELAKRQGQGEIATGSTQAAAESGLTLELIPDQSPPATPVAAPVAGNAPAEGNLPNLPSHLEELDAQFLAEAQQAASKRLKAPPPPMRESLVEPTATEAPAANATAAKPRPASSAQGGQQNRGAAKNVFAAKNGDKPASRKGFAIAIGALTVASVCGIGGYFWWQLQPKSAFVATGLPVRPPPATGSVAPPAALPAPTLAAPPAAPAAGMAGATRPAVPDANDQDDDSAPVAAKGQAKARRAPQAAAVPPEAESPIRVTKAPLKVNPNLLRGYDAFNRGELAVAQAEYERAQKADPRNTDALHGLAAIALRQGRIDQAEWLYRKIIEADPQDAVATATLINLRGQVDPGTAESRLKSLSAAQPELAAPHFSLGNLYARHGRWDDAQQAYFRAYSAEPDNPDILYNLAISLEHLRQNKLAAQYYSQAIAAAQTRPAGFDKARATARLNALQP